MFELVGFLKGISMGVFTGYQVNKYHNYKKIIIKTKPREERVNEQLPLMIHLNSDGAERFDFNH